MKMIEIIYKKKKTNTLYTYKYMHKYLSKYMHIQDTTYP